MPVTWLPQICFALCDPVTLTFSRKNHITCRLSQYHSLYQVWRLWDHSFWSYAADKQTEADERLTPVTLVGVRKNSKFRVGVRLWGRILSQLFIARQNPFTTHCLCVKNLLKIVTKKWKGRESNPIPLSCESKALTIKPPCYTSISSPISFSFYISDERQRYCHVTTTYY